jgi:hypothetical protein
MINGLGSLKSISFKGVGPAGADIYDAEFEKGALEWRLIVGTDGKYESIGVRPLP